MTSRAEKIEQSTNQNKRQEIMSEGIFYAVEGHDEKLKEWIEANKGDRDLLTHFGKQMEVAVKNASTMVQQFEKQLEKFTAAVDAVDDFFEANPVTEDEPESEIEVVSS